MPLYEFRCRDCGKVWEEFWRNQHHRHTNCPDCHSDNAQRLFSASHMIRGADRPMPARTCCGKEERCETPPCSTGGGCHRDQE